MVGCDVVSALRARAPLQEAVAREAGDGGGEARDGKDLEEGEAWCGWMIGNWERVK